REGTIGAGTGTVAFGWKGGIGTSSRKVAAGGASYTVGVLVQSNYGGSLVIDGVEVGPKLPDPATVAVGGEAPVSDGDGSIMMVVATDAPLDARLLERLARRAVTGLARTGTPMSNGSGDYVIAFSTVTDDAVARLRNDDMSGPFVAVADAPEDAILNSLFKA